MPKRPTLRNIREHWQEALVSHTLVLILALLIEGNLHLFSEGSPSRLVGVVGIALFLTNVTFFLWLASHLEHLDDRLLDASRSIRHLENYACTATFFPRAEGFRQMAKLAAKCGALDAFSYFDRSEQVTDETLSSEPLIRYYTQVSSTYESGTLDYRRVLTCVGHRHADSIRGRHGFQRHLCRIFDAYYKRHPERELVDRS